MPGLESGAMPGAPDATGMESAAWQIGDVTAGAMVWRAMAPQPGSAANGGASAGSAAGRSGSRRSPGPAAGRRATRTRSPQ